MNLNIGTATKFLRCPQCRLGELATNGELVCTHCGEQFPIINGRPFLLRKDNPLFRIDDYMVDNQPEKNSKLYKIGQRFIPELSVNLASDRLLPKLKNRLSKLDKPLVLVVGGGSQKAWLNERLAGCGAEIVYSDIDVYADIDVFCDAHELPFFDSCFDAVITTAVLEHVLYPEHVASEITRVLKLDALLYSELPFMQQVHEGAYDFTRYTLGGHRRLFNQFSEIEAGMVAGPGTALAWSIENFALAFFSGNKTRQLVKIFMRIGFSWFKYFDFILKNRPAAMDGASCSFFFGQKIDGQITESDIVARYTGAKHLTHT